MFQALKKTRTFQHQNHRGMYELILDKYRF